MDNLLEKVRKLNWVLQQASDDVFSFSDLCEILSDIMDSNVYIVNKTGKVLALHYKIEADTSVIVDPVTGIEAFPAEYNQEFLAITDSKINLSGEAALKVFKNDFKTADKLHTVIPIVSSGGRLGTMILTRYDKEFGEEELILGEYGATVVGLEIQRKHNEEIKKEAHKKTVVQMAISTLSYSEIEAMQQIFAELGGKDGLLVASKVADRSGITRSVIVNALRKLESASIIESRSLGMKGTHIKILNDKFLLELNSLEM